VKADGAAELDGPASGTQAIATDRGREAANDLVDALLLRGGGAMASESEWTTAEAAVTPKYFLVTGVSGALKLSNDNQ